MVSSNCSIVNSITNSTPQTDEIAPFLQRTQTAPSQPSNLTALLSIKTRERSNATFKPIYNHHQAQNQNEDCRNSIVFDPSDFNTILQSVFVSNPLTIRQKSEAAAQEEANQQQNTSILAEMLQQFVQQTKENGEISDDELNENFGTMQFSSNKYSSFREASSPVPINHRNPNTDSDQAALRNMFEQMRANSHGRSPSNIQVY